MKLVVRIIIFLLALLFSPHFGLTEEIIPLPVLKKQSAGNKELVPDSLRTVKQAPDFFDKSQKLSPVEMPKEWRTETKKTKKKALDKRRFKKNHQEVRGKKSSLGRHKSSLQSREEQPSQARFLILPTPDPIKTKWERADIEKAKQHCEPLLQTIKDEYEVLPPIRLGRCGTAYPVKFRAIDLSETKKTIVKPAATFNCDMAVRVSAWVRDHLQPLAREILNTTIVQIRNVASYSCRNRYNADDKKLSEHALANAFDIAGFTTAEGDYISVLQHWEGDDPYAQFLHAVHASACKTFVVVLGPEANEAHKNHFHFDLGRYPVCE